MLFLIVFLCALLVAVALGLLSGLSDLRGMIIPNAYPVGIFVAFVFAFAATALGDNPEPFQKLSSHLWAGGVTLLITFIMTMTKLMGAGDSKLLSAYAFWMGALHMLWFMFVMALAGAALALVTVLIRRFKPFKAPKAGSWIGRSQAGESVVPYGIPIAAAAIYTFFTEGYISLELLKTFLGPVVE